MDVAGFNPPQQQRSRETLHRLLDAAEELLERKAFAETSVAEIAERAGSSVGSFYQRFDDKEALLHSLDRRLARQSRSVLEAVGEESWTGGAPLPETLAVLIRPWVASYHERRGLRRALLEASRRDLSFRFRAAETERKAAEVLGGLLEEHREEIAPSDPRRAARHLVVALVGYLRETVLYREFQSVDLEPGREELVEAATRLALGYLGLPIPGELPTGELREAGNRGGRDL